MRPLAYLLAILCPLLAAAQPSPSSSMLVYFGTYTGEKSQGIYAARLDLESGLAVEKNGVHCCHGTADLAVDDIGRAEGPVEPHLHFELVGSVDPAPLVRGVDGLPLGSHLGRVLPA